MSEEEKKALYMDMWNTYQHSATERFDSILMFSCFYSVIPMYVYMQCENRSTCSTSQMLLC